MADTNQINNYGPIGQLQREARYLKITLPDLESRDPAEVLAMAREFQRRVLLVHSPACDALAAELANIPAAPAGTYNLKATTATLPEPDKSVWLAVSDWRNDLYEKGLIATINDAFAAGGWKSALSRQRYSISLFDGLMFGSHLMGGSMCQLLVQGLPVQPVPEANYNRLRGWFHTARFKKIEADLKAKYVQIASEVLV